MNFKKSVNIALNEKFRTFETRKCPDQFLGKISEFTVEQQDFPVRWNIKNRISNTPCLIMILESPHTEEFGVSPGPAKGKTGKKIREHILSVNGLSEYNDYGLIIINACQYQCSLGYPTNCLRDELFLKHWHCGGNKNFIQRLNKIYQDDDVIVNCCTKGNTNPHLRILVDTAIYRIAENISFLKRTHPSSWHSERNRNYVRN